MRRATSSIASGRRLLFFHPQHNHWHQSACALPGSLWRSAAKDRSSPASKSTFCLVDTDQTILVKKVAVGVLRLQCRVAGDLCRMGDDYHQSLEGQELDITGAPEGIYYLTHQVDPENIGLKRMRRTTCLGSSSG